MAVALALFDGGVHYETLDGAGKIPLSEFTCRSMTRRSWRRRCRRAD
jgi:hypothetical protein